MIELLLVDYIKYALFFSVMTTGMAIYVNGNDYSKIEYARIFMISLILFPVLFGLMLYNGIDTMVRNGRRNDE